MEPGAEPPDQRLDAEAVDELAERERAIRATVLGVILGLALALLGRRRT